MNTLREANSRKIASSQKTENAAAPSTKSQCNRSEATGASRRERSGAWAQFTLPRQRCAINQRAGPREKSVARQNFSADYGAAGKPPTATSGLPARL